MAITYDPASGKITVDSLDELEAVHKKFSPQSTHLGRQASSASDFQLEASSAIPEVIEDIAKAPQVPSIEDFKRLFVAVPERTRQVMRLFAKYGNGLTSRQISDHLRGDISGLMAGLNKTSARLNLPWKWKEWFTLRNGRYEVNPTAHKNLVAAIQQVESPNPKAGDLPLFRSSS